VRSARAVLFAFVFACAGTAAGGVPAKAAVPLSLAPATAPMALAAPTDSTAGPVEIASAAAASIKHVFVILQENHTFDNYFGTYPGADGFPAGTAVPVDPASVDQGFVTPWRLGTPRTPDLDHGTVSAMAAYDGGKMDGFVRAQSDRGLPGEFALGYYDQADLPLYWFLAHHYVLGDRFFSSAMGGSLVNHQYWVGARSAGFGESVPVDGIKMPTIFDRLDEAGKTWHFYVKSYDPTLTFHNQTSESSKISELAWVPLLTMPSFVDNPTRFSHIGDLSDLYKQLPKSDVADVNYIVQGGTSEHPPGDVANGQDSVVSIITSIMRSPIWKDSAILLGWDDWGGWYDHVPPPQVDADGYGYRVPLMIISPYAKPGFIFHETADFTSMLKFMERLYGLRPLTSRDAAANDLLGAFDFEHPARAPVPPVLGGVPDLKPRGPTTERLIQMYSGIIGGASLLLVLAMLPRIRRGLLRW
jgi:phospholipase C